MPEYLTKSVMPGSASGKPTMSASLKFLNLMDSNERPTKKMSQLIESEDNYGTVLSEVVREAYPFLKDESIDLKTTTTDKLVEQFEALGARGSTVSKCMAFFLAACKDSGIKVSQYVKAPQPPSNRGSRRKPGAVTLKNNSQESPLRGNPVDSEGYTPFEIPIPNAKPVRLMIPDGLSSAQWRMFTAVLEIYLKEFEALTSEVEEEAPTQPEQDLGGE